MGNYKVFKIEDYLMTSIIQDFLKNIYLSLLSINLLHEYEVRLPSRINSCDKIQVLTLKTLDIKITKFNFVSGNIFLHAYFLKALPWKSLLPTSTNFDASKLNNKTLSLFS